ncbi:TolC family outer membrane protein [Leisingera daeponensis]|uniref:TolC family outer membrane protein n=1 Tax=Leisingera daeponensis TaxID=405746 RepID=UPI001C98ACCF|nr:TolC family outer membrane protein [Leisingera daeponensis]MBY6057331.1 TolC family outer membrane protein [Leisingera daeponensis]
MRMKFPASVFKAFVFAGGVAATALVPLKAAADNLSDAMIGAYRTSGLLEQNRALLRAADEDVALGIARLRPVIEWTTSATHSYSRGTSQFGNFNEFTDNDIRTQLQLTQLVYDGGETRLRKEAAQELVLATRQRLISIEQQVLFAAVQAYVGVLQGQENVSLRRNNLRLLQEELKAAQDRFEVGEVTRTDVALAESRVAAARANLTDSEGTLRTARATYLQVVGHAPGSIAGQPRLPSRSASLEQAQSIALRNQPDLLAQQFSVKASDLLVQATTKALGPSVNFTARAGIGENLNESTGTSSDFTATLSLNQQLYTGGLNAATRRRAIASADAERGTLINVQRSVQQAVSAAYFNVETARATLISSAERVRASKVAFDGIREEATLGARTTLDVLQAEQEYLDAQTGQVNARADQALAAYQLLRAQGLLTAEHLGLPVEIYDPTLYYNLVKDAPAQHSKRGKDLDRVLKALGRN